MTKPTSRKSTGLGTKSVKTSLVTPTKKRLKIKRSDASSKRLGSDRDKQVLMTETIGMGDQIVLFAERTPSKLGGYMTPLSKESQKNEFTPFDDDHFNCHSNDYYFLRKSHEDNSRVPMGKQAINGHMYNRTAILCEPSAQVLHKDGTCTVEVEKAFRDACFTLLEKKSKAVNPRDEYVDWTSSHSMTATTLATRGEYKSLDMVFVDESVGKILYDYFVPAHIEPKDVHEFLLKNGIHNIFTRKNDGRFSDYAVNTFNFPSDTVHENDNVVSDH